MAVNLASKYASKIQEVFTLESFTDAAVNKDYEWSGVSTVNVFAFTTQALGDYTRSGANRYGTPSELQNTVQTMLVAKDRSFSTTIDRATLDDTMGAIDAGKFLKLEIKEQIVPEIDVYRLDVMYDNAVTNSNIATAAVTASNAYTKFLAGQEELGNAKVPLNGRIAFVSYAFYNFLKLDSSFMLASEVMAEKRVNGMVGMVDGVKIVPVPASYLNANVSYILTHPSATVAVEKLTEYNVHPKPQGISGALIEGRVRYDAFVLDSKVNAIWVHKIA